MMAAETDTSFVDAIRQKDPARRVQFQNSGEEFDALDCMTDAANGMAKMYMQALNSGYALRRGAPYARHGARVDDQRHPPTAGPA